MLPSPSTSLAMLIRQLRKQAQLTQQQLGDRLGVGKAAISAYEKGKAKPSDPILIKLATAFDLSIDTLRDEISGNAVINSEFLSFPPRPNQQPFKMVRHLPLAARATFADSFAQDYSYTNFERIPVVSQADDPDEGLVVDINGDSMEPQLRAGMKVLVEEVPAIDGWKLTRPGVYVVVYRNHLVVKRIKENTLASNGELWLYSDNPEGGRELVKMDDLRSMWRVRRIVHGSVI